MFRIIDNIIEFNGWRVGTLWNEGVPATVQAEVLDALGEVGEEAEEMIDVDCGECDDYRAELEEVKAERDAYAVMLGIER